MFGSTQNQTKASASLLATQNGSSKCLFNLTKMRRISPFDYMATLFTLPSSSFHYFKNAQLNVLNIQTILAAKFPCSHHQDFYCSGGKAPHS